MIIRVWSSYLLLLAGSIEIFIKLSSVPCQCSPDCTMCSNCCADVTFPALQAALVSLSLQVSHSTTCQATLAANITNIPCETFGWDVLMSWYISTTFLLITYNGTDVREKSDLSLPLHISWDGLPWYLVQSLNTKVRGRHVERSPPGDCPQSALSLHWELPIQRHRFS